MAKRKGKKDTAQKLVSTAATGLPAPLQSALGSRWGSRLAILIAIALFASGVATVDWTGGVPHVHIDRERAQEVRHDLYEDAESVAKRQTDDRSPIQWPAQLRR